jgi:putative transposase
LEGQRGQLISLTDRQNHAQLVSNAVASGARQDNACEVIGFSTRTLQRWRIDGEIGADTRPTQKRRGCNGLRYYYLRVYSQRQIVWM